MWNSHEPQGDTDLLAAIDDAAAEVAAGFGVNHSGNVLLGHQVCVELFAAFCLFPVAIYIKTW